MDELINNNNKNKIDNDINNNDISIEKVKLYITEYGLFSDLKCNSSQKVV